MPRPPQLIGMIEIDLSPRCGHRVDGTLPDLLRSLQHEGGCAPDLDAGNHLTAISVLVAEDLGASGSGGTSHMVQANLLQLHIELELELRRFLERLLAAM